MKTSPILKVVYLIIAVVVISALGASFTHMKDWTLHVLPTETPQAFGWVNAIISELTPLAGSLYLMHVHRHGGPKWPAWVMLIYGFSASAIGQVHAAGDDPTMWALIAALLPVTAAFVLIKVLFILLERTETAPSDQGQQAPVNARQNPSAPAQVTVHQPASPAFTGSAVNAGGSEPLNTEKPVFIEHSVDGVSPDQPADERLENETPSVQPKGVETAPRKPAPKRSSKPKRAQSNTDRTAEMNTAKALLEQGKSVRSIAGEMNISVGKAAGLKKEIEAATSTDEAADAAMNGMDIDAELAKLLAGENDKNED